MFMRELVGPASCSWSTEIVATDGSSNHFRCVPESGFLPADSDQSNTNSQVLRIFFLPNAKDEYQASIVFRADSEVQTLTLPLSGRGAIDEKEVEDVSV